MNSETLILEDKDTSVTAFGGLAVSPRWQRPIYRGPEFGGDIFTGTVVFLGSGLAIVDPTSPLITIFPQQPRIVPLDAWVEIDVRFPPKETRIVAGRIVRTEQATFKTAFADELQNDWSRP